MALGTHAGSSMGPGSLPGIWEAIPWCGNEGGWTAGYRTGDQNWDFERKNYPGFFLDTPPHPALMFDTFSVLHKGFMLGKEGKWSDFESSGRCSAPLFQTKKRVVMMFHWLPRILPDTLLHLFHGYFGSSTKSSAKLEKKNQSKFKPCKSNFAAQVLREGQELWAFNNWSSMSSSNSECYRAELLTGISWNCRCSRHKEDWLSSQCIFKRGN